MELFFSQDIDGQTIRLDKDESGHCIKVLRHRAGDEIAVIDGNGTLYHCQLTDDDPKGAVASILSEESGWGSHPYNLTMAVCPTKNADRYEWFAEKACEVGLDCIVPVIGDHSERKIMKDTRLKKILVSAAKQSLKALVPAFGEIISVRDFILSCSRLSEHPDADGDLPRLSGELSRVSGDEPLKLIAYCFEEDEAPRISIKEALSEYKGCDIIILIGPEGDFSKEEAQLALANGFKPIHLGTSRLRTETAALTAVEAVYFNYM